MLVEARRDFIPPKRVSLEKLTFAEFMEEWLKTVIKPQIQTVTYASYCSSVRQVIVPYFKKQGILLKDLTARDLQLFYAKRLKSVKATSVKRNHANIRKALQYAVKMDMLPYNPADRVDLPRQEKFIWEFYSPDEAKALFEAAKGHRLEPAILLATIYGLRRGEIVGLRWSSIDFTSDTITIRHTVTSCYIDGRTMDVENDRPKSKASLRTLPPYPYVQRAAAGSQRGAGAQPQALRALLQHRLLGLRLCGSTWKPYQAGLHHGHVPRAAQKAWAAPHPLP